MNPFVSEAYVDPFVSEATIDENMAELSPAGFSQLTGPPASQMGEVASTGVIQGKGQMIFWERCNAFYMKPGDEKWKEMPSTEKMPLQFGWKAYLTGGPIWIERK